MNGVLDQINRAPFTYLVLLAYLTLASVTGFVEPNGEKLQQLGAAVGVLIQQGEVWRLLAYAFLHFGAIHLALNSYFLMIVGPSLEQSIGTPRFALLYVIAAIGGGVGGSLWHDPRTPLVGGSGALFGMMGAALALNMRRGRHLLDFLNYGGPRQLLMLIVANLAIGLLIPMVSNAGHVGGLVAGFVLMFCFMAPGPLRDPVTGVIRAGWIALFAALLLWCWRPVTRWDFLYTRIEHSHTEDPARARELERALRLSLGPDGLARLLRQPSSEGR